MVFMWLVVILNLVLLSLKIFQLRFKARFNSQASAYALNSYDAMTALIKAIDQTPSEKTHLIAQNLHQQSFNGLTGKIKFDHKGDVQNQRMTVYQVEDQAFKKFEQ